MRTLNNFNEEYVTKNATHHVVEHRKENRTKCHHVYLLKDGDEVVYVGQTTAEGEPTVRPLQHTDKEYDNFTLYKIPINVNIDVAECYFITKYNPKYNASPGNVSKEVRSKIAEMFIQ